jgi:hypothetical protein
LCPSFAALTVHQRWFLITFYNLCPVCLSDVHFYGQEKCQYRFSDAGLICSEKCDNAHNQMLHPEHDILPPISCFAKLAECDCTIPGNLVVLQISWM